jgi:hypothetical protein
MQRLVLVIVLLLAIVTFTYWGLRYVWYFVVNPSVSWKLAVSLDQLANTTINGNEDETISSRAGRHSQNNTDRECWAVWLCWLLDKIDPSHCEKSIGV